VFEFAKEHAWLIPALPLFACVIIAAFGKWLKGAAHFPAWLAMAGSCILALSILFGMNHEADPIKLHLFDWFQVGTFKVPVDLYIDHLTALYLSFITGIGLLIFIYAAAYMKGDYAYWRFFAYLSIFVFFMCALVMGNNFILLYLGWEGVGLASYLLIGYYYPRPSAVAAAKKAFITNRVGDFGLAIGVFLIYKYFGTVEYTEVFAKVHELHGPVAEMGMKAIPFCLMLGAFGKSAQFPLHVWLPDAMEGPTPVSALIHAATMVTAGIYLIARTMPIFGSQAIDPHHTALNVVACVGGFTALLAATIALCQYDLKRIWAYSTLSQLGYMFLGLGVMATTSAVFHVFTHAFFKALLFLSAGSVMHAMGGELDIRKMSGVKRVMPITRITMLIGCLALAGFPGLAGFFSKDEIIGAALNSEHGPGFILGIVALIVALMTAYYTFRLYFKVFEGPLELPATAGHHEPSPFALADDHGHGHGDAHGAGHGAHDAHGHAGHDAHAHKPSDGSPLLWLPLVILCIGAIGAGYLGVFGGTHVEGQAHGGWFHHFVGHTTDTHAHAPSPPAGEHKELVSHTTMMIVSGVISVIGIAIAAYFYLINRAASAAMASKLRPIVGFLYNKWYWDELYSALLLKPLWIFAHILSYFDRYVVDGLVFIVGFFPQLVGYSLKPTQRGLLQRYAVGMVAGLAAVVLAVLYLVWKP
jgi:NADH-quinone oxidoreductase subunit L